MVDTVPDRPIKGRGAVSNASGRFEPATRHAVDDGWSAPAGFDDEPPRLATTVGVDTAKRIIVRNDSPDLPFDQSINPYKGCEHGCVYCYARPTHAYLGLSPGLDFETRLFCKPDAARLLDAELRAPNYKPECMALGTNTDPYQPIERERRITRGILEVLSAFRHPVGITTKGALVVRDIDLLAPMAAKNLAAVTISVTTLDRDLARTLEPRAPTPAKRLAAIRALAEAGIPTAVNVAPIVPGLTDHEMESILEAAVAHGATSAGYTMLRLASEIKDLFQEWLSAHAPLRKERVLSLVRQVRGGKLNDPRFGHRMSGTGPYADLIARRFDLAVSRLRLNERRWNLDTSQFRVPQRAGDQLRLL
jgi:DNA repair photolyase